MKHSKRFGNLLILSALFLGVGKLEAKQMNKDEIIKIAIQRAKSDEYGMFTNPYFESAREQKGLWIVKLRSEKPSPTKLGVMYINVTIDAKSGKIISVDSGDGS